jgi:hypothetical protein
LFRKYFPETEGFIARTSQDCLAIGTLRNVEHTVLVACEFC